MDAQPVADKERELFEREREDLELAERVHSARFEPPMRDLVSLLKRRLAVTDSILRNADGTEMYRYQGYAKCLEVLIDEIANGPVRARLAAKARDGEES